MLRRAPFAIPWPNQVPALVELVAGRPVDPPRPPDFRDAVVAHRLTGFADAAIEAGRLRLPPEIARELRDAHLVAALRAAAIRSELTTVAPLLAEACGVEPLVIKGPVVSELLYEPRTLRPFADLDLLLPRAALPVAGESMRGAGYRPDLQLRPGFAERYRHDLHFSRGRGRHRLAVELHWRISDDRLGERLAYERLEPSQLGLDGHRIACPSPPDHLLVLALHFMGDRLRRLLWVEDLRRAALSLSGTEWALAFERAADRDLSWVLHRALDYARHHLGLERERPSDPGPAPRWGPIRAIEAYELAAAWDLGHLTSIPWRERPGYLRAILLPSGEGLRGAAGDPDAATWRLALRRARRAFAGIRSDR